MKKIIAITLMCLAGTVAFAAGNLADEREAAMKKIGHAMGDLNNIVKGKSAYDAATVKSALTTISTTAKAFPDLFPAGSENADNRASPDIWKNMADFKAQATKLGGDADALLAKLPADQDGVKAAVGTLGADCGACHKAYRLKD